MGAKISGVNMEHGNSAGAYDFDQLDDAMGELEAVVSASGYHGMVCGRMIGGNCVVAADWSDEAMDFIGLAPDTVASAELNALLELPRQVVAELSQQDFGFQLLLPPDTAPLPERAEALGQWCEGFLAGLVLAGQGQQQWDKLPAELVEGFNDLASIAQMGPADEDAERDLMELLEYVRLVVLSAYAELVSEDRTVVAGHATSSLFKGSNKLH
jgi:uncharacterized protein YgfB (UPF0149 family)